MAEKRKGWLRPALEYGPILAFFVGYFLIKDRTVTIAGHEYSGFIAMTAVFVPLMVLTTWLMKRLTGRLSAMQLVTLAVVVVFGGLTIWFNDERFFKMKPTIIYAIFAAALAFGLMRGRSYLQLVMDEVLPMEHEGWMILTRRLTAFFLGLAVLNEVVWRNFSDETWVSFKTFGLTILIMVFFVSQARIFEKYGTADEE